MVAHVIADRVADTSTTTGTSDFTVSGSPPTGYQTIGAVCSTSDTFAYTIAHQSAAEWEVGIGTYSGSNVFVRTTVLASSNSGSAVSFSAGTKDVFLTRPAKGAVRLTRVVTGAGDVTVTAADDIIVVNKGTGAATAVNLPSSPYVGLTFVIKDGKGDAGTNNITITPASGNIDGAATFVMSKNYQAAIVVYNGTEWNQITPSRATLGLNTSDSPQFTAIELGNASDTTVARGSAGVMTVEGKTVATLSTAQTWAAVQGYDVAALTYNATQTWDVSTNPFAHLSPTGNVTSFAVSNVTAGRFYVLKITQDTSARTIAYTAANFKFIGGAAPTLSTGSGAIDYHVFVGVSSTLLHEVGRSQAVA